MLKGWNADRQRRNRRDIDRRKHPLEVMTARHHLDLLSKIVNCQQDLAAANAVPYRTSHTTWGSDV
ncbi:MAG TPA: hypothetical protein DDY14_03235 [Chromatiaceae bacterium]|jgi:hypothetical protein|nr:hypothetical protein [Chromatiaceae bacterium]